MIPRPLRCPWCQKTQWDVLRALDTGALALECVNCKVRIPLVPSRDVPTLEAKATLV